MTWNYRVLEEVKKGISVFKVVEVYYDNHGNIKGYINSSANILVWDNYNDLKGTYEKIGPAFAQPVIKKDENGFPYERGNRKKRKKK